MPAQNDELTKLGSIAQENRVVIQRQWEEFERWKKWLAVQMLKLDARAMAIAPGTPPSSQAAARDQQFLPL